MQPEELPRYTYDDYLQWEGRWELIEGIPFAMTPSPSYAHQRVSQRLAFLLEQALEGCDECEALLPVDWKVSEDTVVQPDNLVVCHRPEGPFITRAPALIFEIVSPSSARKDRLTKFRIYEREGVRIYCVVLPDEKRMEVFDLMGPVYVKRRIDTTTRLHLDLGPCSVELDPAHLFV